MKRREFVGGLIGGAAAWPLVARGRQLGAPIVGFLGNSTAALEANLTSQFRAGLREHGYIEGQTIQIQYRWAEGDYSRFPGLVNELIAAGSAVIVTAGTPAAAAVAKATKVIPCVMAAVGDPVGTGLIASLARPGGNLTGLTAMAPELEGKRLALLREIIPNLSRIAVFWNPDNPFNAISKAQVQDAADLLKITAHFVEVRASEDLDGALASVENQPSGALVVLPDRVFLHERTRLMSFAAEHRLPGVYAYRELVGEGGLMSYGPSYADLHRRAARFVDKILKGANPADLPVEQPAVFEFVANVKAANALNLTFPVSLLARADEVIE